MRHPELAKHQQALQARLGVTLAGALTEHAEQLPHDISERLRFARSQAMGRARQAQQLPASAATAAAVFAGGSAALGRGGSPWWQRAAAVLPLALLVSGLVAIDLLSQREQVLAAADIDAELLADKLPPAAYADPGFAEFLRSPPGP